MRVGCLSSFSYSPQTASQSIFFISISFLSYQGSLMFQAFKYPWRMPRGSPCHVKVLNFTVALMPFLNGLCNALGGNRLQRHANTEITDLGPCLKFMKRLQCPWVSLCHDHTISLVYFTAKGVGKRHYSLFFFLTTMVLSLALKFCSVLNDSIYMQWSYEPITVMD